jgi:hypothetical protein
MLLSLSWLAPLYLASMDDYKQFGAGCLEVLELFSVHHSMPSI